MLVAMGMAAVLCIAIGVFPEPLYALLPYPVDFEPYTGVHVTESLGILMFTALGFVLFLKALDPENTISIDTDWFYRKGARHFMWLAEKPLARYEKAVSDVSETAALPFLHGVGAGRTADRSQRCGRRRERRRPRDPARRGQRCGGSRPAS